MIPLPATIAGTLVFTDVIDGDNGSDSFTVATRSRQRRATVQLLSTPLQAHGRTYQTPTSTAQILLL